MRYILTILSLFTLGFANDNNAVEINVGVLYTVQAEEWVGDISTYVDHEIETANDIYRVNDIKGYAGNLLRLNLGYFAQVDTDYIPDSNQLFGDYSYINNRIIPGSNGLVGSDFIEGLRQTHNLDIVIIMGLAKETSKGWTCGIATPGYDLDIGGIRENAIAMTAVDCGVSVLAHELGHIMGLGHAPQQNGVGFTFEHGRGWGVQDEFATIMAYPQLFGNATRSNYFSNPNIVYKAETEEVPVYGTCRRWWWTYSCIVGYEIREVNMYYGVEQEVDAKNALTIVDAIANYY